MGRWVPSQKNPHFFKNFTKIIKYDILLSVINIRGTIMANIDDAQTTAIYYAKGQALPSSVQQAAGTSIVETPTTAVGFQVHATRSAMLYVNIRTAAALATAISPDNVTYYPLDASQSDAIGMTTIHVPAGWYVKLTGTMANLAITAILN
jgi:hypothetical protein